MVQRMSTPKQPTSSPGPSSNALDGLLQSYSKKSEAVQAIIDFYHNCEDEIPFEHLTTALRNIAGFFETHATKDKNGNLTFDIGPSNRQLFIRYSDALESFRERHVSRLQAQTADRYEELKMNLSYSNAASLKDADFADLAARIVILTNAAPSSFDPGNWQNLVPTIFGIHAADRAIHRIDLLHQEFQWLTYGNDLSSTLTLWIWRSLKQLWKLRDDPSFKLLVKAEKSEAFDTSEILFFGEHETAFVEISESHEVFHQELIHKLVHNYAITAEAGLRLSGKHIPTLTDKLHENRKSILYSLVHNAEDLSVLHLTVLRETAAQYLSARETKTSPAVKRAHDIRPRRDSVDATARLKQFPLPTCTSQRYATDYAWYPFPETRPLAVAYGRQIARDMQDPGILSQGLKASDLITLPKAHVRPDAKAKPWKTYHSNGILRICWRVAKHVLWKRAPRRPTPRHPRTIVPRKPSGHRISSRRSSSSSAKSQLSPVIDPGRRVSKSSTVRLSTTKLRGGGPKANSSAWGRYWNDDEWKDISRLAGKVGITVKSEASFDYLVAEYLVPHDWDLSAALHALTVKQLRAEEMYFPQPDLSQLGNNHAPEEVDVIRRLAASQRIRKVNKSNVEGLIDALEEGGWRWEQALEYLSDDLKYYDKNGKVKKVHEDDVVEEYDAQAEDVPDNGEEGAIDREVEVEANGEEDLTDENRSITDPDAEETSDREDWEDQENQENLPVAKPQPRSNAAGGVDLDNLANFVEDQLEEEHGDKSSPYYSLDNDKENAPPPQPAQRQALAPIGGHIVQQMDSSSESLENESVDYIYQVNPRRFDNGPSPGEAAEKSLSQRRKRLSAGHDGSMTDHISELENDNSRRESLTNESLWHECHTNVLDTEIDKQCHPCPNFAGQFHHYCRGSCPLGDDLALDLAETNTRDAMERLLEWQLEEDVSDVRRHIMSDLKRVLDSVGAEPNSDVRLNNAQIHAHLVRAHETVQTLLGIFKVKLDHSDDYEAIWADFVMPNAEAVQQASTLANIETLFDAFNESEEESLQHIVKQIGMGVTDIVKFFHNRRSHKSMAGRARSGEQPRGLSKYYPHARRLAKVLSRLAEFFGEDVDTAGLPRREFSHEYHHHGLVKAIDDLLLIRRGLGERVDENEWRRRPQWADYCGHGIVPSDDMRNAILAVLSDLGTIGRFFSDGDSTDAISSERLRWITGQLRGLFYSESVYDADDDSVIEVAMTKANNVTPTPARTMVDEPTTRRRSSVSVGGIGVNTAGQSRHTGAVPSPLCQVSPRQSPSASDKRPRDEDGDTEQQQPSPKRVRASDSGSGTGTSPRASPKGPEQSAPQVPTRQQYNDWMFADEVKAECTHRGIEIPSKATKAKLMDLLVKADKEGNTGMGVMNCSRVISGQKKGKKPDVFNFLTLEQKQKKFGDRLAPEE